MHNDSIEKPGKLSNQFVSFGDVPSSDVWNNIVVEINPTKKRRRFLWIFFLLIGVTSFGSFLLLKTSKEKNVTNEIKKTINSSNLISKRDKIRQTTINFSSKKSISNQSISSSNNQFEPNFSPSSNLNNNQQNLKGFSPNLKVLTAETKVKSDGFESDITKKIKQIDSFEFDTTILVNRISNYKLQSSYFQNLELIGMNPFKKMESNAGFSFSIVGGMNFHMAKVSETNRYYQYNFGVLTKYRFQNNFALESGFIMLKNRMDGFNLSGLSGLSNNSTLNYRFDDLILAIPIKVSFQVYQKKIFKTELFTGVQFQHMTKKRDLFYDLSSQSTIADYSAMNYAYTSTSSFIDKFNVMSQIGFNLYFKTSNSFQLRISPFYQYYTKKCERFSFVTQGTKHWVGIHLGIEF